MIVSHHELLQRRMTVATAVKLLSQIHIINIHTVRLSTHTVDVDPITANIKNVRVHGMADELDLVRRLPIILT